VYPLSPLLFSLSLSLKKRKFEYKRERENSGSADSIFEYLGGLVIPHGQSGNPFLAAQPYSSLLFHLLSPQSIPADIYQLSHIPACYFISYHLSLFQLIYISSAIF
jgi:hypothetical protein